MKRGVENYIVWSEMGSGFGEPGGTPPPRIPRSTPPGSKRTNPAVRSVPYACGSYGQLFLPN